MSENERRKGEGKMNAHLSGKVLVLTQVVAYCYWTIFVCQSLSIRHATE